MEPIKYIHNLKSRMRLLLGYDIEDVKKLSGDKDNATYQVLTRSDIFFVKKAASPLLIAEMEGLELLAPVAKNAGLEVPRVHSIDKRNGYLALDWMESVLGRENQNASFGRKLAAMHAVKMDGHEQYGLDRDNYIGLTPQVNAQSYTWIEFFRDQRLRVMMGKLVYDGKWQDHWDKPFENLSQKLGDLLPEMPFRSVVHGDLWAGNVLFLPSGRQALVDPSVYIGHGEVDVAMTQLFGGFDSMLLESYHEISPPESGWKERYDIYNLYHLMNHLLIFGDSYRSEVDKIVRRYS